MEELKKFAKKNRMSVSFYGSSYSNLEILVKSSGSSINDVVKDALYVLHDYFQNTSKGHELVEEIDVQSLLNPTYFNYLLSNYVSLDKNIVQPGNKRLSISLAGKPLVHLQTLMDEVVGSKKDIVRDGLQFLIYLVRKRENGSSFLYKSEVDSEFKIPGESVFEIHHSKMPIVIPGYYKINSPYTKQVS